MCNFGGGELKGVRSLVVLDANRIKVKVMHSFAI